MSPVSHQTIKLSKGKHSNPADGACVMELASMLAGEPFSDHPVSVCPLIGALLRTYNDTTDDERRADLYPYASCVVGTRAGAPVEHRRAELVRAWMCEMRAQRIGRVLPARLARKLARMPRPLAALDERVGSPEDRRLDSALGSLGQRAVVRRRGNNDQTHVAFLALLDELIACEEPEEQQRAVLTEDRTGRAFSSAVIRR